MGFAVVAEEVRSLAQRSALAARETSAIIEDSIHKTRHGTKVSAEAAAHFQEINEKVRRVDELVAQIATASREQDQGIGQVNGAVRQMDSVTQANAANAEQSASVAHELNTQADSLHRIISELSSLLSGKSGAGAAASPLPASAPALAIHPPPSPQRRTPATATTTRVKTATPGPSNRPQWS
jgi:methyl-accepting chemotaxis protein